MNDRDALLKAIFADPKEDTPRLAYADWLDEFATADADRARGEFIRLQVEFERLPEKLRQAALGEKRPGPASARRAWVRWRRAEALLKAWEPHWRWACCGSEPPRPEGEEELNVESVYDTLGIAGLYSAAINGGVCPACNRRDRLFGHALARVPGPRGADRKRFWNYDLRWTRGFPDGANLELRDLFDASRPGAPFRPLALELARRYPTLAEVQCLDLDCGQEDGLLHRLPADGAFVFGTCPAPVFDALRDCGPVIQTPDGPALESHPLLRYELNRAAARALVAAATAPPDSK